MPRVIFNEIPEKISGRDFVKQTDMLWSFHWDKDIVLYRCPYSHKFALVDYRTHQLMAKNAYSVSRDSESFGVTEWYKGPAEAVRDNYDFLHKKMCAGNEYARLAGAGTNIEVPESAFA